MKDRPHSGTAFADASTIARPSDDDRFMRDAFQEGRLAAEHGDVQLGAASVRDGAVVARAGNRREVDADPTAHAEILAIREAARALGRWRLSDCALYVTVEPCAMCAGAANTEQVNYLQHLMQIADRCRTTPGCKLLFLGD